MRCKKRRTVEGSNCNEETIWGTTLTTRYRGLSHMSRNGRAYFLYLEKLFHNFQPPSEMPWYPYSVWLDRIQLNGTMADYVFYFENCLRYRDNYPPPTAAHLCKWCSLVQLFLRLYSVFPSLTLQTDIRITRLVETPPTLHAYTNPVYEFPRPWEQILII